MKIREKVLTGVVGALLSLALCAGSASAYKCANVTIEKLAVFPGASATNPYAVFVQCDPAFTGALRYYLHADLGDGGYATLLTAYSLGEQVDLWIEGPTAGSIVTDLAVHPAAP